jgi:hypothetical protein
VKLIAFIAATLVSSAAVAADPAPPAQSPSTRVSITLPLGEWGAIINAVASSDAISAKVAGLIIRDIQKQAAPQPAPVPDKR